MKMLILFQLNLEYESILLTHLKILICAQRHIQGIPHHAQLRS